MEENKKTVKSNESGYKKKEGTFKSRTNTTSKTYANNKSSDGAKKPYDYKSKDGAKKPFEYKSKDGAKKPYDYKSKDGAKKPFDYKSKDGAKKPFDYKSKDGAKKPFEYKSKDGAKKPYDNKSKDETKKGGFFNKYSNPKKDNNPKKDTIIKKQPIITTLSLFYMTPTEVTAREFYDLLLQEANIQVDLWEDLNILQIELPNKNTIDFEPMTPEFDNSSDQSFIQNRKIKTIFAIEMEISDFETMKPIFANLVVKFGGFICTDSGNFKPLYELDELTQASESDLNGME